MRLSDIGSKLSEGYRVVPGFDREKYQERQGLEGPFHTKSGKVVYYDKAEGKYYDPDTDMYIEYDDWRAMNEQGVAGPKNCWPGHRKVGTQPGTGKNAGKRVNDCEKIGEEVDPADVGEYDREGDMTIGQLKTAEDAAAELQSILDADENLPEWVQSKITKAVDYLDSARDYMKSEKQGVEEGMLDNPGAEDSPVAQAIIRRILLQRTDLLAKYGPEKVGQAVDEVADFVGDVDEIGSSDVSGWIRHVEQMLGNMGEGVAKEVGQIDELSPATLTSYKNKARAQVQASPGATNYNAPTTPKIANRARGAVKADNRLHGFGPVKKSKQGVAESDDIQYHQTSGTKAGHTISSRKLSNKPQASKSDVTLQSGSMHHNGKSYNFPKGTVFTQLPGGIFAQHPSVPETHPGFGHLIRQSEDNVRAIHNALTGEQGVEEGLGKSIKRGMAGWGAFDKDKPADVVKRVRGQDTDTLKTLSRTGPTGKGSPAELQQKAISRELKKREQQGVAEGGFDDASPMTKDTVKSDRIRSLKNLIAIAKEQGRQLRVQELELELKKLQGVAEVSKATLDRYVPKAVDAHGHADFSARMSKDDPTKRSYHVDQKRTAEKRRQGISRALDRMSKMEGVAESTEELYGLRVGDSVKAVVNGKRVQGDVIDIFPETMEVELLLRGANAGKTVTVDVRDTEALSEQGVAEGTGSVNVGDDVIITGAVKYKGATGVVDSMGRDGNFIVVNLYNHGKQSFQSTDVSLNDYAGSDEEESEMQLRGLGESAPRSALGKAIKEVSKFKR